MVKDVKNYVKRTCPLDMQANLKIDQSNLQQVVERVKTFVDRHHTPRTFQEGDRRISDLAYKLQLQKDCKVHRVFHVSKLRPYISQDDNCIDGIIALGDRISKPDFPFRICGTWIIIKKISDIAYKLQLPKDCKVHQVFHVSKLRPYISQDENSMDGIVALGERTSKPDVHFRVLDRRERQLQNRSIPNYLEAWTSHPLKDATWESEALVHRDCPSLMIEANDL
ncbi:hypothetical protein KP509_20G017200 [Ceratopteris richardii]|uniref:Tf2-1-like SH3-like domain-containing protein n=1 Tax=Ceratopteris richardii TaxID=49495 RepID=A0A8T2SF60_CERRI|nr:hypothetical protein KP509_20G017200 [Ceratopteris richardii]